MLELRKSTVISLFFINLADSLSTCNNCLFPIHLIVRYCHSGSIFNRLFYEG